MHPVPRCTIVSDKVPRSNGRCPQAVGETSEPPPSSRDVAGEHELEFQLRVVDGERIGLRISSSDEICAVHPDTVAHTVGVQVGDIVVAVLDSTAA